MNKKQRALTIVAMIAFIVIGAFHYFEIRHAAVPSGRFTEVTTWRHTTAGEVLDATDAEKATWVHPTPRPVGSRSNPFHQFDDLIPSIPVVTKVSIPDDRPYLAWIENLKNRPDAKMPWFMLGVIYTAFMFLLKDKRGRSS